MADIPPSTLSNHSTTSLSRALLASSKSQGHRIAGGTIPVPKRVIIGAGSNARSSEEADDSAPSSLKDYSQGLLLGNCSNDSSEDVVPMEQEKPTRGRFTIYNGEAIPEDPHQRTSPSLTTAKTKTRVCGHITILRGQQGILIDERINNTDEDVMEEDKDHNVDHYRRDLFEDHSIDIMEVDPTPQPPLIVVDGANIAHYYADSNNIAGTATSSLTVASHKRAPDPEGINIVAEYFLSHGCRIIVVLPSYWLRAKPSSQDTNQDNALMITPQLEILQALQSKGLLCCAPPSDDDDAYVIAIARRAEMSRPKNDDFFGRGYVLSNDYFRDAIHRDNGATGLKDWLSKGSSSNSGSGRISYTFCQLGSIHEPKIEFVPNPRHELICHIEKCAHEK